MYLRPYTAATCAPVRLDVGDRRPASALYPDAAEAGSRSMATPAATRSTMRWPRLCEAAVPAPDATQLPSVRRFGGSWSRRLNVWCADRFPAPPVAHDNLTLPAGGGEPFCPDSSAASSRGHLRDERALEPWLDSRSVWSASAVALIMSQIEQAEFRTGALRSPSWSWSAWPSAGERRSGAAPVVFVGAWFQGRRRFRDLRWARHLFGLAMLAASLGVVVFALRRGKGTVGAREAAAAVVRNERRLIALVTSRAARRGSPTARV